MEARQQADRGTHRTSLRRWWLAGLMGWLCVMCWWTSSQATSVILLTESQMVEMSTLIVRGKVVSQRYVKGPNNMGVVTLVTIDVLEEVLGRTAPKQVIVRHFGGMIGKREIRMIGGPKFTTGNEVLVFLQQSKYLPEGEYLLVGLTQGKWIVRRADPQGRTNTSQSSAQSKEPEVVRSLHGLKLYKQTGTSLKPHDHADHADHQAHKMQANRQTLTTLVQRLQKHWSAIQLRRKNHVIVLPRTAPTGTKVNLPKPKIETVKNLKVVKPPVRTPERVAPPQKRSK